MASKTNTRARLQRPAQQPISPAQGESASAAADSASPAAEAQNSNTEGAGAGQPPTTQNGDAPNGGAMAGTEPAAGDSPPVAGSTNQAPSGETPAEGGNTPPQQPSSDTGSAEPASAGDAAEDQKRPLIEQAARAALGDDPRVPGVVYAFLRDEPELLPGSKPYEVLGRVKGYGRTLDPADGPAFIWLTDGAAASGVAAGNLRLVENPDITSEEDD